MNKLWRPKLWTPRTKIQRHQHIKARRGSWWWCCCEEEVPPEDCIEYTDNFNRANSTDVGGDWTEQYGDWSINNNALRAPSTELGVITNSNILTQGSYEVEARASQAGDAAWLYWDSGNALEIVFGTPGKVSLLRTNEYSQQGLGLGVPATQCEMNFSLNTYYKMRLCLTEILLEFPNGVMQNWRLLTGYIDDVLILRGFWEADNFQQAQPFPALGTGVGVNGSLRGTIDFENYAAYKFEPTLAGTQEKCAHCGECCWPFQEDPPNQLIATIEDTGGSAFCFDNPTICDQVNGMQFTITKTDNPTGGWKLCVLDFYPIVCPCAYYELSGIDVQCDGITYDTFSLMVGRPHQGIFGSLAPSCVLLARLWENRVRDPPLANHFFESVVFQGWYAQEPYYPFARLDALCGDFPFILDMPETPFCQYHGQVRLEKP